MFKTRKVNQNYSLNPLKQNIIWKANSNNT